MSRTLKRPMFRRGGTVNDGIMTGIVDREEKKIGDVVGRARELTPELETLLREFTPKTKLPLGQVGFALASGVDPLEALGAGYSQFVKRDDAREAAIRGGAAKLGIGQAMAEAKPSTSVLKNRKAAIINIKADPQKFPDGPTEQNIIKETARLNKLDETGKGINLQRVIFDREKDLRNIDGLPSEQARRLANFEYVVGPKIQKSLDAQDIKKTVQGRIIKRDNEYVTRNKPPGIYFDPKTGDIVEITNELETIVNPPELLALL